MLRGASRMFLYSALTFAVAAPMLTTAQPPVLTFQASLYTRLDTIPGTPTVNGAGPFTTFTSDLRRNGKQELIVGMGTIPPTVKTNLYDVTRDLFGNGAIPLRIHHPTTRAK